MQFTTTLLLSAICFTSLLFGNNYDNKDWSFNATATGKTTGHIGNLIITNNTNKVATFWLQSYIIPPQNGKQGYAVFKETAEQIEVKAGDSYFHQLYGYCININLPSVAEKEAFPDYSEWLSYEKLNTAFIEQNNKIEFKQVAFNSDIQLEKVALIILEAVSSLEKNYYKWKTPLQVPDLYPGNANLVKQAIIQQAVWQFATALQGQNYKFSEFEQSITEQKRVNDWLNLNGSTQTKVDNKTFTKQTYFNYQCQKLWSIISDINFYVNSNSRNLIPRWEIKTDGLEEKYIEFHELWESVALTGNQFKTKDESKIIPDPNDKDGKKMLTYVSAGIGAAGIITGVVLLANNKKGCTDKSACNYDEDANKDDGSCDYGNDNCANPCKPIAGCVNETACNYNPNACVDDNSCEYGNDNCANPCAPIAGCVNETACNYNPNACVDDGSCISNPCDERCLKKGTITFNECGSNKPGGQYYFISYEDELLDPLFDNCFNGYEGQEVLFNYEVLADAEIDSINKNWLNFFDNESEFTCEGIAQPVRLTCLPQNATKCNYKIGKLLYGVCSGKEYPLIEIDTSVYEVISPNYFYCDFFYSYNETTNDWEKNYEKDQRFRIDYEKADFDYPCQPSIITPAIITCIEVIDEEESQLNKTFDLFAENKLLTITAQTQEHSEEAVLTNIIGINYYQPLSPTLFIQNQTSLGYAVATGRHFINNKITLNTQNPYLPLHYGLGFNSNQLTDLISLKGWQNQFIWNMGIKLPMFKKLQLEIDVHKTFDLEDNPNCSIRLFYNQFKNEKKTKSLSKVL